MNKWSLSFGSEGLTDEQAQYLESLPREVPDVEWVWREMDRVWNSYSLDNSRPVSMQDIGAFYSHPVWIMNGLFTEIDSESRQHREALAAWLNKSELTRIADYGGGSGVLAKTMTQLNRKVTVDIIEPFAFGFFKDRLASEARARFLDDFDGDYDVVIAQDVLEHVDNPIDTAFNIANAVKDGGDIVFANCFYPCIECHLPATFYLRYTFRRVMEGMGLDYVGSVPGASHAHIYRKSRTLDLEHARAVVGKAKLYGLFLNAVSLVVGRIRRKDK